ncbi:hypothetical protein BH09VER1_BH09VER1_16730 [soil metagenome]
MTRRLHGTTLLLITLLGLALTSGCRKPFSLAPNRSATHASNDFSSYAIAFPTPAEEADFEKKLKQWCSEKGYASATPAELQTLQNNAQPGAYQVAEVKYLDPANPACSLLITYRRGEGNEALVGLLLSRDGSSEALERQSAMVEAQRDAFLKDFEILKRIN